MLLSTGNIQNSLKAFYKMFYVCEIKWKTEEIPLKLGKKWDLSFLNLAPSDSWLPGEIGREVSFAPLVVQSRTLSGLSSCVLAPLLPTPVSSCAIGLVSGLSMKMRSFLFQTSFLPALSVSSTEKWGRKENLFSFLSSFCPSFHLWKSRWFTVLC